MNDFLVNMCFNVFKGKRQNSGPVHLHLINLDRIKKDLREAGFQCIDGELLRSFDCNKQQTYVIALAMNTIL